MKKPLGTFSEIASITGGTLKCLSGAEEGLVDTVSTDTRSMSAGALFFAVRGERTDGHLYLNQAFGSGAALAVVEKNHPALDGVVPGVALVEVEDTLEAMHLLAASYRERHDIPVVAVTGSSGKTTTKDMVRAVLAEQFEVLASQGSYNNEIGLPMTIFGLTEDTNALVLEMGMRGLGQIDQLCRIARPDIGIITNVGLTHFELLGSAENIFLAKGELAEAIGPEGYCILNGEDSWTEKMKSRCRGTVKIFGLGTDADIRAMDIRHSDGGSCFRVLCPSGEAEVMLPYPGLHNILDALAAIQTGLILGMDPESCSRGLSKARLSSNRLEFLAGIQGSTLINDCYNANPDSTRASLNILGQRNGRKVAVLGDMRELGALEKQEHLAVGRYAVEQGTELLVTVGEMARDIRTGALEAGLPENQSASFDNNTEAARWIAARLLPGDTVLIKGSRIMGMESIVELLKEVDRL